MTCQHNKSKHSKPTGGPRSNSKQKSFAKIQTICGSTFNNPREKTRYVFPIYLNQAFERG